MRAHPRRYAVAPWADIAPADLAPMGEPEWAIEYRYELHMGLLIRGQFAPEIGMLGIRCACQGSAVEPISMAIADGPVAVAIEPAQSNPRRREDREWR